MSFDGFRPDAPWLVAVSKTLYGGKARARMYQKLAHLVRNGKRVAEALNHFLAMRQLRESERYNRMLFENSPIGLTLHHKSGLLLEANPAFAEILGSNIEEVKGLILGQALPDGIARQGWGTDEYLGETGKLSSCEGEFVHRKRR